MQWCSQNLPFGDFRVNDLEPPLPFDDDSFDLVHSLSIFTHLDAGLHVRWMEELVRVVKPGGLLLPTFHGRSRVEYMRMRGPVRADRARLRGRRAGGDRLRAAGGSDCAAYHPERYIREVLAAGSR